MQVFSCTGVLTYFKPFLSISVSFSISFELYLFHYWRYFIWFSVSVLCLPVVLQESLFWLSFCFRRNQAEHLPPANHHSAGPIFHLVLPLFLKPHSVLTICVLPPRGFIGQFSLHSYLKILIIFLVYARSSLLAALSRISLPLWTFSKESSHGTQDPLWSGLCFSSWIKISPSLIL